MKLMRLCALLLLFSINAMAMFGPKKMSSDLLRFRSRVAYMKDKKRVDRLFDMVYCSDAKGVYHALVQGAPSVRESMTKHLNWLSFLAMQKD